MRERNIFVADKPSRTGHPTKAKLLNLISIGSGYLVKDNTVNYFVLRANETKRELSMTL